MKYQSVKILSNITVYSTLTKHTGKAYFLKNLFEYTFNLLKKLQNTIIFILF